MYFSKAKSPVTRGLQLALAATLCFSAAANAQEFLAAADLQPAAIQVSADRKSPAERYALGQALRAAGEERGAFLAFLSAAERGHGPAQRRLGEFYDRRNSVTGRDLAESIRWYQAARESGEEIREPSRRVFGAL